MASFSSLAKSSEKAENNLPLSTAGRDRNEGEHLHQLIAEKKAFVRQVLTGTVNGDSAAFEKFSFVLLVGAGIEDGDSDTLLAEIEALSNKLKQTATTAATTIPHLVAEQG